MLQAEAAVERQAAWILRALAGNARTENGAVGIALAERHTEKALRCVQTVVRGSALQSRTARLRAIVQAAPRGALPIRGAGLADRKVCRDGAILAEATAGEALAAGARVHAWLAATATGRSVAACGGCVALPILGTADRLGRRAAPSLPHLAAINGRVGGAHRGRIAPTIEASETRATIRCLGAGLAGAPTLGIHCSASKEGQGSEKTSNDTHRFLRVWRKDVLQCEIKRNLRANTGAVDSIDGWARGDAR